MFRFRYIFELQSFSDNTMVLSFLKHFRHRFASFHHCSVPKCPKTFKTVDERYERSWTVQDGICKRDVNERMTISRTGVGQRILGRNCDVNQRTCDREKSIIVISYINYEKTTKHTKKT